LTFLDTIASNMENILTNSGLIHIRVQIFGYLDHKTLKNCREAFAKRFGEDWYLCERLVLVQSLLEFGDKVKYGISFEKNLRDFIPGWDKAVKKFDKMASLNDLYEVIGSLKVYVEDKKVDVADLYMPLHFAACKGHVKVMELLLHTDLNINERVDRGLTPFIIACLNGHTEVVNLMITSSKEYGIDLNACCDRGWTVFFLACLKPHMEIVKLMVEKRTQYEINIHQKTRSTDFGDGIRTAWKTVNYRFKYCSKENKASFKELKRILKKAYLEDKNP